MASHTNQIPIGLKTLYKACRKSYPEGVKYKTKSTQRKYRDGGSDPLDYIRVYANPGDAPSDIAPHWHYIGFGLSDLYGDGRAHKVSQSATHSGYGFELTFRLKRKDHEDKAPVWPTFLMQSLSRYVFQSGNILSPGDHVSWSVPLDNAQSRLQHMLLFEDPQLGTIQRTPSLGPVQFLQIVGICFEELHTVQMWSGPRIIELMQGVRGAGGPWLINDMTRETIFELDASVQEAVNQGIKMSGSNFSSAYADCSWFEEPSAPINERTQERQKSDVDETALPQTSVPESEFKNGLSNSEPNLSHTQPNNSNATSAADKQNGSHSSQSGLYDINTNCESPTLEPAELSQTKFLESVHLQFDQESGFSLPLVLYGRLKHGRPFTYKCLSNDGSITLMPTTVPGALVDAEHHFAAHGSWLQVLLTDEEIDIIVKDYDEFIASGGFLPNTFEWKDKSLKVTFIYVPNRVEAEQ